jgi:hypothetical protein
MSDKYKIDAETAALEFSRCMDAMGIEDDFDDWDTEDTQDFEGLKKIIVKCIMRGSVVIDEIGQPVFTPQRSEDKTPLTFYEPDGTAMASSDKRQAQESHAKSYMLIAAMTKTHSSRYYKMKRKDLDVCTAIATLFLGA